MAKVLRILTDPDPILRQKSVDLDLKKIPKKELAELIADMTETMLKADGVGLAAPQIGKNIRLVSINTADGPLALINPKIVKKSLLKEWGEEGCLSVPEVFGEVRRHKKITCSYLDPAGKAITYPAEGLMARVIQHEVDHLDGVLFIDKMRPITNIEESRYYNKIIKSDETKRAKNSPC